MKRFISAALSVFVLLILCCLPLPGAHGVDNTYSVDVVLVMDCSGSMRTNDPDKLALQGAGMLSEMIQADGCRYGVVMFEGDVTGILPLQEVGDEDSVNAIKTELESIYHQKGQKTDLPRGLYEAIQILLESEDIGNTRIIIALTDGEDDPESGRSMKDVDRDRRRIIAMAGEMKIPIYVIGLNVNGSVSQDKNVLISSETGADAYEIAAADQIEPTLTAILNRYKNQPAPPEPTPTPTPT
jgi:Mg-chelatase subunit ChlD